MTKEFNYNIWKTLIRNSETLRFIPYDKLSKIGYYGHCNNQFGGAKTEIEYKGIKYYFKKIDIDTNRWALLSDKKFECVAIVIDKSTKSAEIHGIISDKGCVKKMEKGELYYTNEKVGTTLLKITIKMLKKYKEYFGINVITLSDNSVKFCKTNKKNIILSYMSMLKTGETWCGSFGAHKASLYGSYGFKPITRDVDKMSIDKIRNELYEEKKQIILNMTLIDIDIMKYIKMTGEKSLIKIVKSIVNNNPTMLLTDFINDFLDNYDENCKYFSIFYERLFFDISKWDTYHLSYGLFV